VRTEGIVLFAPHFNQNLGLPERSEIGCIQAFIPQFAVKGFTFTILPRGAWLNEKRINVFVF
jgi:hypothetical protein